MSIDEFSRGMRLTRLRPDATASSDPWLQEIQGEAQQNDDIYHYSSEPAYWEMNMGSEGYVAVRDRQIVASVVKMMN